MGKLRYDKNRLEYVEDTHSFSYYLFKVLKFLGYTVGLVLIYYLLYTLLFTSEEDKRLRVERKLIEQRYEDLSRQADLLDEVVGELKVRDEAIYRDIFNSKFPSFSISDSLALEYSDSTTFYPFVTYTATKVDRLDGEFAQAEAMIVRIMDSLSRRTQSDLKDIPSILPIAEFPLGNTGASLGRKVHPFYKTMVFHNGLDLAAHAGTEVIATADGVVKSIQRGTKIEGTKIVIDHGNGYTTVYSHLSDILVRSGRSVEKGAVIGRVGNTGVSFAPHLHYEVLWNDTPMDPLCYFSGELAVEDYQKILMYAINSGQSLD